MTRSRISKLEVYYLKVMCEMKGNEKGYVAKDEALLVLVRFRVEDEGGHE